MREYKAQEIEKKWQEIWDKEEAFEPKEDYSLPKKYILSMFPYPSGRIHMGHVRNYCLGDAFARHFRKQGFNVLHPIGWDSFGMPAENAAIKHKLHPKKWTYENIDYMKDELAKLGLSFSKTQEFATSDELYTKWEQEFIIKMYEEGILYKKSTTVNWCEDCHTVLANEQVEDGCCWRCDNEVQQKQMPGYYIAITKYAQELLDDLDTLEGQWPSQVLTMQKNWIGRSEGLEFDFELSKSSKEKLGNNFDKYSVFTTRPDTLFGFSFLAVSVDHPISKYFLDDPGFNKFKEECSKTGTTEESIALGEKIGFKTSLLAVNPLNNNEKVPWYNYMKPFVLAAWTFLTIGIALGAVWAYYELGWGGW